MICVLDSPPGESELEVLHSVERAHNSSITCCTCSPPPATTSPMTTRLIATADDTGEVHVYDLRRITLLFRCVSGHSREVRALHFPSEAPGLLVSGDVSGAIFVWPTSGVRASTAPPLMKLVPQETTPARTAPGKVDFEGIASICSSSSSQDARSATHTAMLYVGVEAGQVFAWDFRSLTGNAQPDGQSTRRSAILRRRSSASKAGGVEDIQVFQGGVASRRSSGATLAEVPSTKSWMAHLAGVLSLQSVPWPGELLSLGTDGVVKIWDSTPACVGHILTTAEQTSAAASAWKFVRRDHTDEGDDKGLFERIAREVIAKHQRRLKKERSRQRRGHPRRQSEQEAPDTSLSTPSSLLESESPSSLPPAPQTSADSPFPDASTALINAASALLVQVPFSVSSVSSGMHQGLFGPEEAQHLRCIAKNSNALLVDVADKKKRVATLAPLFSSPEEMARARAKAKAKARAMVNSGPPAPELSSVGSRTLINYPRELERRAASNATASIGTLKALDVEPSQFLRDKLQDAASPTPKAFKSTPKKRLQRPSRQPTGIDIQMDASVVVLARNVSLPKLTQSRLGLEPDELAGTLSSSASAPVLQPSTESPPPSSPEVLPRNGNIERKLKLCQKIVANVMLMRPKTKVPKAQPEAHAAGPPPANARRKASTLALAAGKNPFGPHYTVKQVEQLAIGLARVDEDGSCDLDQQEWTQLVRLGGLDGTSDKNSATSLENLFHAIDRDASGTVSLRELLLALVRPEVVAANCFIVCFCVVST
jgi:hypothetical protein